jgi:hypothetical protein
VNTECDQSKPKERTWLQKMAKFPIAIDKNTAENKK